MGRAYRYQRRIAHIIVTVAEKGSKGGAQAGEPTSKAVATGKTSGKATTKKASNKKSAGAAA